MFKGWNVDKRGRSNGNKRIKKYLLLINIEKYGSVHKDKELDAEDEKVKRQELFDIYSLPAAAKF